MASVRGETECCGGRLGEEVSFETRMEDAMSK